MTVLLNQFLLKWGVLNTAGLGNINPMLYQLAQSSPSSFHDIQTGSNTVACLVGSPSCATGSYGYPAGPNYDLATGLGSVDATKLSNAWLAASNSSLKPTTTIVSAPAPTGPIRTISVTVTSGDNAAPAGTVTLTAGAAELGSVELARGASSSMATFSIYSSQLPLGTGTVVALYAGNSEYLPSSGSTAITTTQSSSAKPAVQVFVNPAPVHETPTAYGNSWNFTLTLREVNGAPTSLVGFKLNGQNATSVIGSWFGTTTLAAFGSISIPLQLTPPKPAATNQVMTLTALDAFGSGAGIAAPSTPLPTVLIPLIAVPNALNVEVDLPGPTPTSALTAATFSAPLLGRPGAASLQLTGAPAAVLRNPRASSSCQWSQQLLLRELAGTGVTLKHFSAGGTDMSASIPSLWGANRVEAATALTAPMCWSGVNAPILIDYEIDGTDDNGNVVSTAMTSPYLNQPSATTSLMVTPASPKLSGTLSLNTAGGSLVLNVMTSLSGQVWTVSVFTSGQSPAWLTVYPLSGVGSGNVYVAPVPGQSAGTYTANILFQSADSEPQIASIPVTYTVQ